MRNPESTSLAGPRGAHRAPGLAALALAAAALLGWSGPALACSVCGCGDPLLAASDPAAITGTLRLQLDTEVLRVDAGTDEQPGFTDRLSQSSYRLNVAYRPVEEVSFTATIPWVTKTIRTVGGGASLVASDLTGLGDVELAGRWAAWRSLALGVGRVQELSLTAGATLPTGRKDARAPDGSLVDPHGQLGTGGWGPTLGLGYRLEEGRWLGFANLSGRYRTEARYFDGTRYQFGSALLWSLHGQFQPARWVALDLGVDGRLARADRATDAAGAVDGAVGNTGGTVLAVAPGLYLEATRKVWLFLRGQVPVVKRLRGEQDVLPSFTAGVQLQAL